MRRTHAIVTGILLALAGAAEVRAADRSSALRAGMQQHCFRCHGANKTEGKVNLARSFATKPHGLAADLKLLEKVIKVVANEEMPPEDEKQPTSAQRKLWLTELNRQLKQRLAAEPGVGRVPIRRMNRFEYNNSIKSLFELARDPFALPERTVRDLRGYFQPASGKMPDVVFVGNRAMGKSQFIGTGNTLPGVSAFPKDNRAEHGFDNRGDHLSLSPVLMESFYGLSQSILNSPEFPKHAGVWDKLFAAPEGLSAAAERQEGRRRLKTFLRRAFRRDVTDEIVSRYHARFLRLLDGGKSFTESMKGAVSAALVSPRFLYIYSGSSPQASGEFELATRLSYFLWNTIPDRALLDLASRGELSDPRVLSSQVDRLLNDRRVKNFCDDFALQWLQVDRLVSAVPDNKRFRDYYFAGATGMVYMVGMHMMLEPLLVFETVMIENRPVTELIDSNFTYRSQLLSQWYKGGPGKRQFQVVGLRFERLPVKDRRWGGVITNAAVMTMTSAPLRTKPITRGSWLATTIFNDPPEPPPASVPEIEADDAKLEKEGLTLRDKLKQHVVKQECAGCHKKIDPLGFALENYDPVGRWRNVYRSNLPVDSSGKLFNKHAFNDVVGFKQAILAEKSRFARAFAGHLLSYALGRELSAGDRPSLDYIVSSSAKDNYRFRTMIKQVVLSPSFSKRRESRAEKTQ